MKLVMTLLARDEADIVDAQITFHLCGRRLRRSRRTTLDDGTTEILERYERAGHLRLIREDGDDMRQSEWVTRMARLAATEHRRRLGDQQRRRRVLVAARGLAQGRPRGGPGAVRRRARLLAALRPAARRRRVLRRADDRAPRSPPIRTTRRRSTTPTRRLRIGGADVVVDRGNHDADGAGPRAAARLVSDRGPALLVPVASTQLERRSEGGWLQQPRLRAPTLHQMLLLRCASRRAGSTSFYEALVVDDEALERVSWTGRSRSTPAFATRFAAARRGRGFVACRRRAARSRSRGRRAVEDAAYAARRPPLAEIDGIVRAEQRVCSRVEGRRLGVGSTQGAARAARRLARR